MKRTFWIAALAALLAAPAWCQEPTKPEPAKTEQPKTEQPPPTADAKRLAEHERVHTQALLGRDPAFFFGAADGAVSEALFDLSSSLIADNALGIDVAQPEAALRAQLGLDLGAGLVIIAAPDESLGAKAGLKVHDVLVQLNDEKVGTTDKLKQWLGENSGKSVRLKLLRAGKPQEVQVTPKKPESAKVHLRWAAKDLLLATEERYRIGVTLSEADDTLRAQLRLASGEGLVVTEVLKDSPAAGAGVQLNDVLIVLDGKRLTTVEAINIQIQEIKDRAVEVRLLRSGKEMAVQVAPRKSTDAAALVDRPVRLWDTQACTRCHANPWAEESHVRLAEKLGANHSVWTDGHIVRTFQVLDRDAKPAEPTAAPQQQIEALKTQLTEMQKTLRALESSLAAPKKDEEKK